MFETNQGEPAKTQDELTKHLDDPVEAARKVIREAGLNPDDVEIVRRVVSKFRRTPGTDRLSRMTLAAQAVKQELEAEREKSKLADAPFKGKVPGDTVNADDQLARVMGTKDSKRGNKD